MKPAPAVLAFALAACLPISFAAGQGADGQAAARRAGPVRVDGHALTDDGGPFLGLGVSYCTATGR